MTDRDTVMREALAVLEDALDAQSNPARADFPTIHEFGAMRRAADAMRACLAELVQTDTDLMRQALDALIAVRANMRRNAPQLSGKSWGDADAAIRALSARLAEPVQPVAVPDGFALLPMKATVEMMQAGRKSLSCVGASGEASPPEVSDFSDVWEAMAAVAPKGGA